MRTENPAVIDPTDGVPVVDQPDGEPLDAEPEHRPTTEHDPADDEEDAS